MTDPPAPTRFAPAERQFLLTQPGIGAAVVQRLEQAGIASLAQLDRDGVAPTVAAICALVGDGAWLNRRRALERALSRYTTDGAFSRSSSSAASVCGACGA